MYPNKLQITLFLAAFATITVTNSIFAQSAGHSAHAAILARPAAAAGGIASDPLLTAMKEELDRERELLLLPGMQRPYFIEYRLDDFSTYEAVATYGALTRE